MHLNDQYPICFGWFGCRLPRLARSRYSFRNFLPSLLKSLCDANFCVGQGSFINMSTSLSTNFLRMGQRQTAVNPLINIWYHSPLCSMCINLLLKLMINHCLSIDPSPIEIFADWWRSFNANIYCRWGCVERFLFWLLHSCRTSHQSKLVTIYPQLFPKHSEIIKNISLNLFSLNHWFHFLLSSIKFGRTGI